jgi:riboflavin kinase
LEEIKFSGTVFSGGGEGKNFLALRWVTRQIKEKIGFAPYLGTLNVKLSAENVQHRKLLEKARSIKVCPAEGYCKGLLIKALIGTLECAIVVPEVPIYPKDVLEIIAAVNLREALKLEDGSNVTVTVNL